MLFGPDGGGAAGVEEDDVAVDDPLFHHVQKATEGLAGVGGVQNDALGPGDLEHILPGDGVGLVVLLAGVRGVGGAVVDEKVGGAGMDAHAVEVADLVHEFGHLLRLVRRRGGDGDAHDLKGGVKILHAQIQPAVGAHGAKGADQIFGVDVLLFQLLHEFGHGHDIARHAGHGGAAGGEVIDLVPLLLVPLYGGLHRPGHIVPGKDDVGPHHGVQGQVARQVVGGLAPQHQNGLQPQLDRRGHGGLAVVGLRSAHGEHGGVALLHGLLHDVLQLSGLVAAEGGAGDVIPLDIQLALAVLLRQVAHVLQGGGIFAQMEFFPLFYLHVGAPLSKVIGWIFQIHHSSFHYFCQEIPFSFSDF